MCQSERLGRIASLSYSMLLCSLLALHDSPENKVNSYGRTAGMTNGIPFVKIADTVEVTVDLKGKRVSGPPLVFKQ